ncbi:hypothetical protein M0R45_038314 [Rubus argutus]|uniref:Uncharacterized protein n=1 Tax=Rubus argutus TaxID=59490 RepID=A0AAW1W380_RUBAR
MGLKYGTRSPKYSLNPSVPNNLRRHVSKPHEPGLLSVLSSPATSSVVTQSGFALPPSLRWNCVPSSTPLRSSSCPVLMVIILLCTQSLVRLARPLLLLFFGWTRPSLYSSL